MVRIKEFLDHAMKSYAIYESIMETGDRIGMMELKGTMELQLIADNCIQMAAVNWCKVFASKKNKSHYTKERDFDKEKFMQMLEKNGISFQKTCDGMRSFRDKYGEGQFSRGDVEKIWGKAKRMAEVYEECILNTKKM